MTPFPRDSYRPLEPYAPDRRPIAVDLSDNTNRWGAHPDALAAVRTADPEALLRYPPVYADRLKEAVSRRFGVPGEAISTGCGSDDLLDSAFRAVCEPGEGVSYIPPTFSMIEIFARMNALRPLPATRGRPGPEAPFGPLPDPARLLEREPGLIYVCRPNNPTGEVHSRAWVEVLIQAVEPDGPVVLLDEAYVDFMEDSAEGGGADEFLHRAVASRRIVVLRTLSKAYGLAGLRVGFAVGAPEVIAEIEKSRGPYKVNRLAEAAAVAALDDGPSWVPDICDAVATERARLARKLTELGLAPLPSGANFLLIPLGGVTSGAWTSDGSTPGDLSAGGLTAALREHEVAVRPFPDLPGLGEAIRVTIGPRPEMDRFMEALERTLDRSPQRTPGETDR